MIKFIIRSLLGSLVMSILPALGNLKLLLFPQIWILFVLIFIALILQPNFKVVIDKTNCWDKGTETQIIWSVYITQLLAVCEATYLRFPDSVKWNIITTISLIAILLGLALRSWAVYSLGKFFTMHLSVHNGQKVIRSGPYKFIRHPSYTGAFFIYVGIPMFLHSWISLIAAAIILPIAWLRRIHYEEKMLAQALGEEYITYCKSVKKVIPGLW
jgi:protein-S-isoprenylcysteine O-methyltransferase